MAGTEWPFTMLGRQFFDGTLPKLVQNIGRLADELKRYNDKAQSSDDHEQPASAPLYIDAADRVWSREGEVEVDADARVSPGDNGAFVQAWVWVSNEDADIQRRED